MLAAGNGCGNGRGLTGRESRTSLIPSRSKGSIVRLQLTRCTVREFRPADAASLARHANDRDVWINLRDRFPFPYERTDAEVYIRAVRSFHPQTSFALEVDGKAIGGIGIEIRPDVYRRSAEIGYWLGRPYWGRGIATEAVQEISKWAFERFDLCRLFAEVFAWNPASMRVLEKAGYRREGCLRQSVTKDGRTIDAYLYALVREPE